VNLEFSSRPRCLAVRDSIEDSNTVTDIDQDGATKPP
jgi:hypothetical protein